MTHQQKALVRYWLSGAALLIALFSQIGHENFRVFFFLALPLGFLLDHFMHPPEPESGSWQGNWLREGVAAL